MEWAWKKENAGNKSRNEAEKDEEGRRRGYEGVRKWEKNKKKERGKELI